MLTHTCRAIIDLFGQACITVNGSNPWDIQVNTSGFCARLWRDRSLGLGESYMDGWWDCPHLDQLIERLLRSGVAEKARKNLRSLIRSLPGIVFNLQSLSRAMMIADRHYDLDNDLFHSFLDPYNQYSCGFFNDTHDLHQAQLNKLALVAGKLELKSGDQLLDIGCGWGGLARFAAERHGCQVTAVNISKEQLRYGREYCRGLPVTFEETDYRAIAGQFDKIVSVGMFEHVGRRNYRAFMEVVHRCLRDDGIFLLHTIGCNRSEKSGCDPWMAKYIFPNGELPSIAQIAKAAEGLFVVEDWHNLGPHYDLTLMSWHANLQRAWPRLKARYDDKFKRMWEYYLLSCAGAFRSRNVQVWQIVMTRPGTRQPACRIAEKENWGTSRE